MKKVYLIILDGFGLGDHGRGDAIFHANKPFINSLLSLYPHAELKTHGEAVGLPEFQTGGSEPGHITIGAGRPIKQFLTDINDQINSGEFFENETLKRLFADAKCRGRIHFLGLCSDGGIHSFLPHLSGLLKFAKNQNIPEIYIHAILDGRDVGERTASQYLEQIENQNIGVIATICGRFYGMDRDQNWSRTQAHFDTLTNPSITPTFSTWQQYISEYYSSSENSDYYAPPAVLASRGQIQEDDIVICFNFRADRMRQMADALVNPYFTEFARSAVIKKENFGVFGKYSKFAEPIFTRDSSVIHDTLGEIVASSGLRQLRISETEKFNHVTFYFSGEREDKFAGEDRVLIPSPKCASYAEKPEMSAREQTDTAIEAIQSNDYALVVQNYANADLVGHSGRYLAAKQSIEVLDECLAKLVPILQDKGYNVIITADHGNSDEMYLPNGDNNASHTKSMVPCIIISDGISKLSHQQGTLSDIAPTILRLLNLPIPHEMIGISLV